MAYNGSDWSNKYSPTNLILSKVCCAEDGNVYIGGQNATLIRGRHDAWEVIPIDDFDDDIWGLAWFNGKLYISTLSDLYTLNTDNSIIKVDIGDKSVSTFYHITAADGVLWSIGRKDVMAFDGNIWTRID